ncbi:MAG: N-formylglutamate amidohydrolase [Acetobacter orientalis]|uniref:N-formylglutamate amidohydrolase n=2 Tax=Acetobacter orientalis TaxID=146474 RepID=A0A251ZZV8_9PROT|nr:N-formylglutamate amidohydrolase [Acetobacter orientalis]OUI80300.1 N-formylglutamate amidohydrolase [Acetobacter orientalis]
MKNFAPSLIRRGLSRIFAPDTAQTPQQAGLATPPPVVVVGEVGLPVVLASPHSGQYYPAPFVQASRQPLAVLRSGEDSFVEELAAPAQALGPPLLYATFPRVYCDVNRAAWDMDPRMFEGPLPAFLKPTHRALSGLGSVPRIVADNRAIYRTRLPFMEAATRIKDCWMPYHGTLAQVLQATHARNGMALLLDLHSMPDAPEAGNPDFVLGDGHGVTCPERYVACAENTLGAMGFKTLRNTPYAGGYITQHYGRPHDGFYALQLEMRRSLYMDVTTRTKTQGFAALSTALAELVQALLALT